MNTLVLMGVCSVVLICGYIFYGGWLAKQWGVGEGNLETPAHTMADGVDYVPAKAPVLMDITFLPLPVPVRVQVLSGLLCSAGFPLLSGF